MGVGRYRGRAVGQVWCQRLAPRWQGFSFPSQVLQYKKRCAELEHQLGERSAELEQQSLAAVRFCLSSLARWAQPKGWWGGAAVPLRTPTAKPHTQSVPFASFGWAVAEAWPGSPLFRVRAYVWESSPYRAASGQPPPWGCGKDPNTCRKQHPKWREGGPTDACQFCCHGSLPLLPP